MVGRRDPGVLEVARHGSRKVVPEREGSHGCSGLRSGIVEAVTHPTDPRATGPLPRITGREAEANRVLDLALRAGDVLLSGGASASEVTATCIAVAEAGGLDRVECDITFTSISLRGAAGLDTAPVSGMRLVHQRALDYSRVTAVYNLVRDLVDGRIDRAEGDRRLHVIAGSRHPYRRSVVTGARAALAGSVALLLGAGPVVTAAAFLTTVLIDLVDGPAGPRPAAGLLPERRRWRGRDGRRARAGGRRRRRAPVAGRRRRHRAAASRASRWSAPSRTRSPASTSPPAPAPSRRSCSPPGSSAASRSPCRWASGRASRCASGIPPIRGLEEVPVQLLAAGVVSASFAVANYAPRRTVPGAAAAGMLGWGVFVPVDRLALSPSIAAAAGAVVIGAGSYALAARQRVPALIYVAAGDHPAAARADDLPGAPPPGRGREQPGASRCSVRPSPSGWRWPPGPSWASTSRRPRGTPSGRRCGGCPACSRPVDGDGGRAPARAERRHGERIRHQGLCGDPANPGSSCTRL